MITFIVCISLFVVLTLFVIFLNGRMTNLAVARKKVWFENHTKAEQETVEDYRKFVNVTIRDCFKFSKRPGGQKGGK